MAPDPSDGPKDWKNAELVNLRETVKSLLRTIDEEANQNRRGIRKSGGPSRVELEEQFEEDVFRCFQSPVNRSTGGRPYLTLSQRASLERFRESLKARLANDGPPDDEYGIKVEECLKDFVRKTDPQHPFVNEEVAAEAKEKKSRQNARRANSKFAETLDDALDEAFDDTLDDDLDDTTDTLMGGV